MRVGLVFHGHYPSNRGVDQVREALAALGHETVVFARRPSGAAAEIGDEVIWFPEPKRPRRRLSPLFWGLGPGLESEARRRGLDALYLRETILAPVVLAAARRLGIPAYVDVRENNAAMYQANVRSWLVRHTIKSRSAVRAFERRYLPRFEAVFTSSQELKDWLEHDYPALREQPVRVIDNLPSASFLASAEAALAVGRAVNPRPVLVYTGGLARTRGVQEVIGALPLVFEQGIRPLLRIVGQGPYEGELRALTERLGLAADVEFWPMQPAGEVPRLLAACDVGLMPYWLNEQAHLTMPGKLYEYMALGLPMVASARGPVLRILDEVGCGLVYERQTPEAIAQRLVALLGDPETMRTMGARGRTAVLERYNWRSNIPVLASVFGNEGASCASVEDQVAAP